MQTVFLQCSSLLRCRSSNGSNCCLDVDESAEYGINHSVYTAVNPAPPHSHLSLPHYLFILPINSAETAVPSSAAFPAGLPHARIGARVCSVMVSWSVCVPYPLSQQAAVAAVDFDTTRLRFEFVCLCVLPSLSHLQPIHSDISQPLCSL